jgi:hypothetical protein
MAKQPGIWPSLAALQALSLEIPRRRPHSGMLMKLLPYALPPQLSVLRQIGGDGRGVDGLARAVPPAGIAPITDDQHSVFAAWVVVVEVVELLDAAGDRGVGVDPVGPVYLRRKRL